MDLRIAAMTPRQLLDSGKLQDALKALTAEVRDNPTDVKRRTFLFELLCFTGDYERAEKHLEILSGENQAASLGALLYRAALNAERLRQDMFAKRDFPAASENSVGGPRSGFLNGIPFQTFADADARLGSRLEVFAAGNYLWIPFEHIESIEISAPSRLRDLLWAPAKIRTGPAFTIQELGEVFVPVLTPFSSKHPDDSVRLGRATVWETDPTGETVPFGQKLFLADDEEIPVLEVRSLKFNPADGTS
jgi:type VI secretion system protein ImpE